MANSRRKKPEAEQSRAFLLDIVKSYYLTTEQEKEAHRNQGALKYLKDTMVSCVVLSPNPVKRMRKESFLNYFTRFVLPPDYDTLISYTDPEQNLRAFLGCSYLWEEGTPVDMELEGSALNDTLIPFFLLQDLQQAAERNLDEYLRQKVLSPYANVERTARDERQDAVKEEKYMHFVYTVQYYEIFLEEFRRRIMENANLPEDEKKFQKMQTLTEQFNSCTEKSRKIMLGKQVLEITQECMEVLTRKQIAALYPHLYVYHFIYLMAMLRILVIAEYVNINHGGRGVADQNRQQRRLNVERMISERLKEFDLFFFHCRENPNLSRIFKELTVTAEKQHMIPDLGNKEEMDEFYSALEIYIKQIRKKKVGKWDAEKEAFLLKCCVILAKPFLSKQIK